MWSLGCSDCHAPVRPSPQAGAPPKWQINFYSERTRNYDLEYLPRKEREHVLAALMQQNALIVEIRTPGMGHSAPSITVIYAIADKLMEVKHPYHVKSDLT